MLSGVIVAAPVVAAVVAAALSDERAATVAAAAAAAAAAARTQCTGEARIQARRSVPKTSLANIPPTALAPMRGMSYTPLIPTKPETIEFRNRGGTCGRGNTPVVLPLTWPEPPGFGCIGDDHGDDDGGGSRSCPDDNDGDPRVAVVAAAAVGGVGGGEVTMPTSSSQRGSARQSAARWAPALCPTRTKSFRSPPYRETLSCAQRTAPACEVVGRGWTRCKETGGLGHSRG